MKIGLLQICSKLDPSYNLNLIESFLAKASKQGVHSVFLPECFYSMSSGLGTIAHPLSSNHHFFDQFRAWGKKYKLNLLGGSVAFKEGDKVYNRCFNVSSNGELLGSYDKTFLFNCNINEKKIDEADLYTEGNVKESLLLQLGDLKVGIGICFDLRFPFLWSRYRKMGANLLSISSAFTRPTGKAHWHTLLRARAIENQCFVVASAQVGENNKNFFTYGHSLLISPWGEVIIDAKEEEGLFFSDINLDDVKEVRSKVGLERYLKHF